MKRLAGATYRILFAVISGVAWFCAPMDARGGIYSPDEPSYFEDFDADWYPRPLGYSNFKLVLSEVLAIDRMEGQADSKIRVRLLERVQKRLAAGTEKLSDEELAGLGADLIRLGGPHVDEALNLLQPFANRRGVTFFTMTHLARVHQERTEWESAFRRQGASLTDCPFPKKFAFFSPEQLNWYRRLERNYYLPLLRNRWQESDKKLSGPQENVDPIFPPRRSGQTWSPVDFQAGGDYLAGEIPPDELAKLPPDAIAVMQQLVLWNPHDPRLLWQLGELYNACGEIQAAAEIFDQCVDAPRNYSNKLLMQHRTVLREAKQRQADLELETKNAKAREEQNQFAVIGIIGGAVVLLVIFLQLRDLYRRGRRGK